MDSKIYRYSNIETISPVKFSSKLTGKITFAFILPVNFGLTKIITSGFILPVKLKVYF